MKKILPLIIYIILFIFCTSKNPLKFDINEDIKLKTYQKIDSLKNIYLFDKGFHFN